MYELKKTLSETKQMPASANPSPMLFGIMALSIVNLPRLNELMGFIRHFGLGKIAVVVSILCILFSRRKVTVHWFRLTQVKIFVCFVLWLFLSAMLGLWPSQSLAASLNYLKLMLFFGLLIKTINNLEDVRRLHGVLVVAMIIFDLMIISNAGMGRASSGGNTLDPNESALLICLMTPLTYYWGRTQRGLSLLVAFFALITGGFAVLLTGSRGGVLTLCFTYSYIFFLEKGSILKKILFICLVVGLVLISMPEGLRERFSILGDESKDYNLTNKHGRAMIWERAFSIIQERPFLGVGMNNFIFAESEVNNSSKGLVSHNFLLQLGTEMGLPGLILMLCLLGISWRQMRRVRKGIKVAGWSLEKSIAASVEIGLVSFFVGGQFLSVAFSSQIVFLVASAAIVMRCVQRGDLNIYSVSVRDQNSTRQTKYSITS